MATEDFIKVISGGQTGADRGGLIAAKALTIPTGGWAPKGFLTEDGSDMTLRTKFKLREHSSPKYPPRTKANVRDSQFTLIFGNANSPGTKLTVKFCKAEGVKYRVFPRGTPRKAMSVALAKEIIEEGYLEADLNGDFPYVDVLTINVAGNRESKDPGIEEWVSDLCTVLFKKIIDYY